MSPIAPAVWAVGGVPSIWGPPHLVFMLRLYINASYEENTHRDGVASLMDPFFSNSALTLVLGGFVRFFRACIASTKGRQK